MTWIALVSVLLLAWTSWTAWDYVACRRAVLRALRVGPASRRALARDVGRASLYVVLDELERRGVVECSGDTRDGEVWFALRVPDGA